MQINVEIDELKIMGEVKSLVVQRAVKYVEEKLYSTEYASRITSPD